MSETVWRSRWAKTGGFRTHYTEAGGDGPVLLQLHGGGYGQSGLAANHTIIPMLAPHFRVLAPDSVGGYGQTDLVPTPNGIHARVDQLEDLVDALCLDRFTIMGNSQGAWTAARYAILHPDQIEAIVLVGSGSISMAMGLERIRMQGTELAESHGKRGTPDDMRQRIRAIIHREEMITDEVVDMRLRVALRPGVQEANQAFQEGTERIQTDPLLRITYDLTVTLPWVTKLIPTIFIWGEADHFASPRYGKQLEKLLPHVPFHWISNAGHQAQSDQPELVGNIILKFLQTVHENKGDRTR
ncbi:MAG: alpha/beta fold hydrolase [Chloroflexota bacterium]|jgi:pimeloyl-ACP methyl ester carboxylesterase